MFSNRLASHLERGVVGFPTTLASSVGLIMASPVILTVTSGFGMGGDTFALAVLLAFIMMQAQVTTFAEAATLIPTTGSVYDYISCGMGRFFAITGALCAYLIVHIFAGTAETILAGIMALVNFESINAQMAAHQNTSDGGRRHGGDFRLAQRHRRGNLRQGRSGADLRHVDHADHFRPVRHFYGAGHPSVRLVRHAAER